MADNDFRSNRSRGAGGAAAPPLRAPADDPLAELARLIGQGAAGDDYAQTYDRAAPQGAMDWAADDRDAGRAPAQPNFDVPRREEPRFTAPRSPAALPRYNGTRDDPHDYAPIDQPPYGETREPAPSPGRQPAGIPSRRQDIHYGNEDFDQDGVEDQQYALEEYEEEAPRRRRGFALVAAVLGLAVLGTAGAFAYRAMFGGPMLPSLPPIIKAEEGPNKIVPNAGEAHGAPAKQAASAGSGEKLVSREEKPVDVPAPPPVTTAPRVVSTIPVFPAPAPGAPGAPPIGASPSNVLTPIGSGPATAAPAGLGPVAPGAAAAGPAATAPLPPFPDQLATPAPPPQGSGARKIHTVTIRPDQPGSSDTAPAPAASAPMPAAASTPPAPARTAAPAARAPTQAAPRSPSGPNAPLAIVPPQGDAPIEAAPRTRTAVARPTPLASTPAVSSEPAGATGGYAVQVSSQRSEAEAHSAYRALAAKYPNQLGGRTPMVRRADLGSKGVYYRALVGPFASMEQAASMCSSLKAAGGSCLVQKN